MPKRSALVLAASMCGSSALAQGAANNSHLRLTQQYDWTFSEIGDVGNIPIAVRNWHSPSDSPRPAGSVNYPYRISTTEVTWRQYYEFVLAYAPVMPVQFRLGIGTSDYLTPGPSGLPSPIQYAGLSGGVPQFTLEEARADQPVTSSWHLFARMVNWLHNGAKPASQVTIADFELGVYDTRTFVRISNGFFGTSYRLDQDARAPGARFWIPSADELLKATYYDPNRYGDGQPGYWSYGNSSENPIPGDPALGGQTNAGFREQWPDDQTRPLDVASYPDQQSPWGLLDAVGGAREITETWGDFFDETQKSRLFFDSVAFGTIEAGRLTDPTGVDRIWQFRSPTDGTSTLRLAAAMPEEPSTTPIAHACQEGWSTTVPGLDAAVYDFEAFDDGLTPGKPTLYAAGSFSTSGPNPVNKIGRFDGERWQSIGGEANQSVWALARFNNGGGAALYAGGGFIRIGDIDANAIARWDGASWSPLAQGVTGGYATVLAMKEFDDPHAGGPALYVAGTFTTAGGLPASNIAKWDGTTWSPLGNGLNGLVWALEVWDDGRGGGPALYAAGNFTQAGGVPASRIARWDGKQWTALGDGLGQGIAPLLSVRTLETFDDGAGRRLYAGGDFVTAGGQPVSRIASWDGNTWSPLGGGVSFPVWTLRAVETPGLPRGLYVGGEFNYVEDIPIDRIARWDGAAWHALGNGLNNAPFAMELLHGSMTASLLAGGVFTHAGEMDASAIATWSACEPICPGDANGDKRVDFADLNAVLATFGQSGDGLPADFTHDGVVNAQDLMLLLGAYGQACSARL